MTVERGDQYRAEADDLRVGGDLAAAGDRYIRAAHEYLGGTSFEESYGATTAGLHAVLMGATCERMATRPFRARNHCLQGILVVGDVLDRDLIDGNDATTRHGAWFEFIGDLRTVGTLEASEDAYRSARLLYRGHVEEPDAIHGPLDDYFTTVAGAAGGDPGRDGAISLARRLEYKRERLPRFLERLDGRERWCEPSD